MSDTHQRMDDRKVKSFIYQTRERCDDITKLSKRYRSRLAAHTLDEVIEADGAPMITGVNYYYANNGEWRWPDYYEDGEHFTRLFNEVSSLMHTTIDSIEVYLKTPKGVQGDLGYELPDISVPRALERTSVAYVDAVAKMVLETGFILHRDQFIGHLTQ